MMIQRFFCLTAFLTALGSNAFVFNATAQPPESRRAPESDNLAKSVTAILESNCGACHRNDSEGGIDYIHNLSELVKRKKIVPGEPEKSRIWLRINDVHDPMPPEGDGDPITATDRKLIKRYISTLSPEALTTEHDNEPKTPPATEPDVELLPVSKEDVIETIHAYLTRLEFEDRRFKRFFVLHHVHNAVAESGDRDYLNLVRAAVSKTLNSLTWAPSVVVPNCIDEQRTVMAFDLRDVEWDRRPSTGRPSLWNLLVQDYPYALKYTGSGSMRSESRQAGEIVTWTGADVPWVRADWFVANATQPQYYHTLLFDAVFDETRKRQAIETVFADNKSRLEQPMTQNDLLDWLRVDLVGNLRRGRAHRAAFTRSGVSAQPRMIERHPALYGSLWNSYDFKRGSQFMNLNARPLGPESAFPSAQFERVTFQHDGGEMIFGLPNGFHGYLLVDAEGNRIPFGPPDVVEDRAKTLGNGIIVNGLSCLSCHKNGLIEDFADEIRFGIDGLDSVTKRVARKLFIDRADLDPMIARDQVRYRRAAIEAMEPFLSPDQVQQMRDGQRLVEPVGTVAKRFLVDTLSLSDLAFELGVSESKLQGAIEYDASLQRLGLVTVAQGGTFSREIWESGTGTSMYQKAAQALRLGTPTGTVTQNWRGR